MCEVPRFSQGRTRARRPLTRQRIDVPPGVPIMSAMESELSRTKADRIGSAPSFLQ